jgi:flagellar basal body rod protein FlgB
MLRSLYTAASGMTAQQLNLDNIANNLANSSTAGFYQRRLAFSDMIYQSVVMPGSAATQQTTNSGLQVGLGVRPTTTETIQTQAGSFKFFSPTARQVIHAQDLSTRMRREILSPQTAIRYSRLSPYRRTRPISLSEAMAR